jgi:hypothetical protein
MSAVVATVLRILVSESHCTLPESLVSFYGDDRPPRGMDVVDPWIDTAPERRSLITEFLAISGILSSLRSTLISRSLVFCYCVHSN